jgi:hypothetical protein
MAMVGQVVRDDAAAAIARLELRVFHNMESISSPRFVAWQDSQDLP